MDMICMALGGRIAEDIMLGKISTGAQNDLEKVTNIAYRQVTSFGFSEKVGLLSFPVDNQSVQKPYSEQTGQIIDQEVRDIVNSAHERTSKLLQEKKDLVEALAQALLKKEVLHVPDLTAILGPRPFKSEGQTNLERYQEGASDYLGE